jgi:hypothetical protein
MCGARLLCVHGWSSGKCVLLMRVVLQVMSSGNIWNGTAHVFVYVVCVSVGEDVCGNALVCTHSCPQNKTQPQTNSREYQTLGYSDSSASQVVFPCKLWAITSSCLGKIVYIPVPGANVIVTGQIISVTCLSSKVGTINL